VNDLTPVTAALVSTWFRGCSVGGAGGRRVSPRGRGRRGLESADVGPPKMW